MRDAATETEAHEGGAWGGGGVEYGTHTKVVEENAILAKQLLEFQVRRCSGGAQSVCHGARAYEYGECLRVSTGTGPGPHRPA